MNTPAFIQPTSLVTTQGGYAQYRIPRFNDFLHVLWVGGWFSFPDALKLPQFSPQNLTIHLHWAAAARAAAWDLNFERMAVSSVDLTTYRDNNRELFQKSATFIANGGVLRSPYFSNGISVIDDMLLFGAAAIVGFQGPAGNNTGYRTSFRRIPWMLQNRMFKSAAGSIDPKLDLGLDSWVRSRNGFWTSTHYYGAVVQLPGYYKHLGLRILKMETSLRKIDSLLAMSDNTVALTDYFYADSEGSDATYHRYSSSQPLAWVTGQREMQAFYDEPTLDSVVAVPMGSVAGRLYKPIQLGVASKSATIGGTVLSILFDDSQFNMKDFSSRIDYGEDDEVAESEYF
jgi:hypothetical protein